MKRLVPILLFLLLLTGCAGQQAELTAPAAAEAVGILGEQVEWLKYPRFKLLDDTVSDDGVLHTVMPTSGGSMVQFGRNLLIHQQQWGQDNSSTLTLTLLSILDGSVLAEYETKVIDMVTPQIVDDCIILCDSGSGDIIWLDSKLQPTRQEHFEPDGRSWYVSPDFTRLYQLDWLEGFSAVDMATGASTSLTEDFSTLLPTLFKF